MLNFIKKQKRGHLSTRIKKHNNAFLLDTNIHVFSCTQAKLNKANKLYFNIFNKLLIKA